MPQIQDNFQLYMTLAFGVFFGVLAVVVPIFLAAYSFFQKFATKVELAATKIEISQIESHLRGEIQRSRTENASENAGIAAKIDALNTSVQLWVNENTRQTALMEGKVVAIERLHHPAPSHA